MIDSIWCSITLKQNPDSSKENYDKDIDRLNKDLVAYRNTDNTFWLLLKKEPWAKVNPNNFKEQIKTKAQKYPNILFEIDIKSEIEMEAMKPYLLDNKSSKV